MPRVGEKKKVYVKETREYIWIKCPDCGGERWQQTRNYRRGGRTGLCLKCYNERAKLDYSSLPKKGGKTTDGHKYILVKLYPEDFFYPMANAKGYVREHRLVMAKHLGRCLHIWEIVHHKEGVAKDDNRIEGLKLVSKDGHDTTTILQNRIRVLEAKIKKLKTPAP